jgi:glycosyltransferase involved in cell wall biosynthesis
MHGSERLLGGGGNGASSVACDGRDFFSSRSAPKLRIAFLTPSLGLGGAERWMVSLARHTDPRRVEWVGTLLTPWAAVHRPLADELQAYMPLHRLPQVVPDGAAEGLRAHRTLTNVLKCADVVLTWGIRSLGSLAARYDVQVVLVSHSTGGWPPASVGPDAGATSYAAVSEPALTPFCRSVRRRAAIVHNGIDPERCVSTRPRDAIRRDWGIDPAIPVIGYAGRYAADKNPLAAALAAAALGPPFHAVYAGQGPLERQLRRQTRRLLGDRVRFVPANLRIGDILSAFDVLVLASPAEGFSLGIAEAWYCRVPVVATRVGAIPELEREHGPMVAAVPVDPSPVELAAAVRLALSGEFRRHVVPRAHAVVSTRYTSAHMAERWTDYLTTLVGRLQPEPAGAAGGTR